MPTPLPPVEHARRGLAEMQRGIERIADPLERALACQACSKLLAEVSVCLGDLYRESVLQTLENGAGVTQIAPALGISTGRIYSMRRRAAMGDSETAAT